jgi:hypothetical protein
MEDSLQKQLYNEISKMETPNQESLKMKFGKHYAVAEQKLYYTMLRHLKSYSEKKSTQSEIRTIIGNIELLFHKGVLELCRKEIRKARTLAYKNELWVYLLIVLEWELTVEFALKGFIPQQFMETNAREANNALNDLLNEINLEQKKWSSRNAWMMFMMNGKKESLKIIKENLAQEQGTTFKSKLFWEQIQTYRNLAEFDHQNRDLHHQKELTLFQNLPEFIRTNNLNYIHSLFNAIIGAIRTYHFDDALNRIKAFETFSENPEVKHSKPLYRMIKERLFFSKAHYHNIKGEFKKAARIDTSELNVTGNSDQIDNLYQVLGFIQLAYAHFGAGEFRKSNQMLFKIKEKFLLDDNSSFFVPLLMLELMVNFELHNFDLIESRILRVEKQSKNKPFLWKFIQLVRLMMKEKSGAFKIAYQEFLESIEQDYSAKDFTERIDILSWLASKQNKISFQEQYLKKFEK